MSFETKTRESVEELQQLELTLGQVKFRVAFKEIQRRPPEPTKSFSIERLEITNQNDETRSLLELLPPDWRMTLEDGLERSQSVQFAREVQLPRFQTKLQKQFEIGPERTFYITHPYALFEILHEVEHSRHGNRDAKKSQVSQLTEENDCWNSALKRIQGLRDHDFDFGEAYAPEKLKEFMDRSVASYVEGAVS